MTKSKIDSHLLDAMDLGLGIGIYVSIEVTDGT